MTGVAKKMVKKMTAREELAMHRQSSALEARVRPEDFDDSSGSEDDNDDDDFASARAAVHAGGAAPVAVFAIGLDERADGLLAVGRRRDEEPDELRPGEVRETLVREDQERRAHARTPFEGGGVSGC